MINFSFSRDFCLNFGNPIFKENYSGSSFTGLPGYFRFGFNPGIIPSRASSCRPSKPDLAIWLAQPAGASTYCPSISYVIGFQSKYIWNT